MATNLRKKAGFRKRAKNAPENPPSTAAAASGDGAPAAAPQAPGVSGDSAAALAPPAVRPGTLAKARKAGRLEHIESRTYRQGHKATAELPAGVVEAAGGLLNRLGNPRLHLFAAARAAVLQRRADEAESEALETRTGRIIHRREGTFVKSVQGFAEDAWERIELRMMPRESDPLDNDDFHTYFRRVQKQQQRHGGELLTNAGPAYGSGRKRVRDAYGRRWRLSGELREASAEEGARKPFLQVTGKRLPNPLRSDAAPYDVGHEMAEAAARSAERHREFSHAVTTSHVEGTRRHAEAVRLSQRVAREGRDGPAFASIGAFRPSEIERKHDRRRGRPCAVKWIVADLDATDPKTGRRSRARAFELASRLLNRLEGKGASMDTVHIVDTGGKGCHVLIPAGAVGNPVSASEHAAERRLRTFWRRVCGRDPELLRAVDFTACRPSQLRRLPGSTHEATGRRAVAVTGAELREWGTGYVYELTTAAGYSPASLPDPRKAKFAPALATALYAAPVQPSLPLHTEQDPEAEPRTGSKDDNLTVRHSEKRGAEKALPAATVRRLREPIAEGEAWGEAVGWPRAVGRHFAANQLARHLAATQASWGRERVERAVQEWNRQNVPALPRSQVRAAVRSAWKWVRGEGRHGPP